MSLNPTYFLAFGLSLALVLGLTPVVIRLAKARGLVVEPREDRWHRRPTALLGGVAIFIAVVVPYLLFLPLTKETLGVLAGGSAIFGLGLIDDLIEISPQRKFLVQIIIAALVVLVGVRIMIIPIPPLAVFLTIIWIVAITNAVNILDNMDGLASGITLVASACSFVYAALTGMPYVALLALLLAGASLGFLVFNFHPAKIFMGDSGSLFLGFSLSLLTILGTWREATNLMAALLFPIVILAVPIFDTTLVSFMRTQNGRSIAQGGRDHSSHRLVFLGFSERKTVILLMAIAAVFGAVAILLKDLSLFSSLIIILLLAVAMSVFGIFLGGVKVYVPGQKTKSFLTKSPLLSLVLMHKKQIFQILVDTTLLAAIYFLAFLFRFGQALRTWEIGLIEQTLPIVILAKLGAFAVFGLYQGDWRYISIHDLGKVFKAVCLGWAVSFVLIIVIFGSERPPLGLLATDLVLTLLVISGVRLSQRAMKEYFSGVRMVSDPEFEPVLILGAGDGGELLLRELRNNPRLRKHPVGFLDDDPSKHGLQVHGVKVLGDRHKLAEAAARLKVKEVYIAILNAEGRDFSDLEETCRELGLTCRRITPIIKGLEE